jgi:Repeat of unknown function (DUF346)
MTSFTDYLAMGPAVAAWGPNRLDIAAPGNDGTYHKYWNGQHWGPSAGWESPGGPYPTAAVSWGPNRLDIFGMGSGNEVSHKYWDGANWHDWESLGGDFYSGPAVVSWGPNRLDIVALGTDGQMHHKYWNGQYWGPSSGWESLGDVPWDS